MKPFWNKHCFDISQNLWLPNEIDLKNLTLTSGIKSNPLCKAETLINPLLENLDHPSYRFIHTNKWEEENIICRKIRIYPDKDQKRIFKNWIGTSRYVYNRSLNAVNEGEKINFYKLRNKYVIAKDNPLIKDWELETPKDIRAEAINDMVKAHKTAFSNLKSNNINHFKVRFRSKKQESSIAIPHTAFKLKNGNMFIYKTYMKDKIKVSKDKSFLNMEIKHTCRLKNNKGKWFLYIPIKSKINIEKAPLESCSLDPGTRKFQTIYSEESVLKIGIRKKNIKKLQKKLDLLQSLRSKKIIKRSRFNRKNNKIQFRLENLVDELHYQTISYLTKTFKTIFIPEFENQELIKINTIKKFRRDLLSLRHYTFKQRLISKSKMKNGCVVRVCTEEYTSKTCGRCGKITDVGSSEIFKCKKCGLEIDRDVNGARNIHIKNIKELYL